MVCCGAFFAESLFRLFNFTSGKQMFDGIYGAFMGILHMKAIVFMSVGGLFGFIFGALPGLGGTTALALLIPFSYGMDALTAMLMFGSAMGAVPFGGSISAIMINTPGTPQNIATCFDGYPLAQKGRAGVALGVSLTASPLGALVGLIILILLIPVVRRVMLSFGPPEFALLVFFGVIALALLTKGNAVKGLISGGVGFLLSYVGYFSVTGIPRFSLGIPYLEEGISLIPPAIGVFAIAEALHLSLQKGKAIVKKADVIGPPKFSQILEGMAAVFKYWGTFLKSSLIGVLIGLIPALGGAVANILAWTTAAQTSPRGRFFGTGEVEGVVAAESANNAKDGGALLPTVAFGVPGSAEMAILLGAFVLHGLIPGPQLLKQDAADVWALILSLVFGNFLVAFIGLCAAKYIVRITTMRGDVVATVVLFVSLLGAYAYKGSILDTLTSLIFGFVGYLMMRYDFSRPTFILGLILGGVFELNFMQSLLMSDKGVMIFLSRPISLVLLVLILLTFFLALVLPRLRQGGNK